MAAALRNRGSIEGRAVEELADLPSAFHLLPGWSVWPSGSLQANCSAALKTLSFGVVVSTG